MLIVCKFVGGFLDGWTVHSECPEASERDALQRFWSLTDAGKLGRRFECFSKGAVRSAANSGRTIAVLPVHVYEISSRVDRPEAVVVTCSHRGVATLLQQPGQPATQGAR